MGLTIDDVHKQPFKYMKAATYMEGQIGAIIQHAEKSVGHRPLMPMSRTEACVNVSDPRVQERNKRLRAAALAYLRNQKEWKSIGEIRSAIHCNKSEAEQMMQRLLIDGAVVRSKKQGHMGSFKFTIAQIEML